MDRCSKFIIIIYNCAGTGDVEIGVFPVIRYTSHNRDISTGDQNWYFINIKVRSLIYDCLANTNKSLASSN